MKVFLKFLLALPVAAAFCSCSESPSGAAQKDILFVYGNSVHMWGDHENRLMSEVMAELVNSSTPHRASAASAYDEASWAKMRDADAVVLISEGGREHPFKEGGFAPLSAVKNLGALHYALDFDSKEDCARLASKIGGAFEQHWSVNPSFHAKFEKFPSHPVARGVKPFDFYDEWYFNIRFNPDAGSIAEIAKTAPPDAVRKKPFGPHSGNPFVRENLGREETVLWTLERPGGGRGLGFTGGHSIFGLYNPELRKLLLNSAVWLAHGDVPDGGFESQMPEFDALASRISKEKRPDYDGYVARWKKEIARWGAK